jgi:hypothetical protein
VVARYTKLIRCCFLISEILLCISGSHLIPVVPDIATFIVLFLNFLHSLVFRTEYISDPALVSVTQWKDGEAPTQLNVIESLDHPCQSNGIFKEARRMKYQENVMRKLHDLC